MPDTQSSSAQFWPGKSYVSLLLSGLFTIALFILYRETVQGLIQIWMNSETFAHGFLILPISMWLIFRKRDQLRLCGSRSLTPVLLLLLPFGIIWVIAAVVDVKVIQQLALVSMLVIGCWAILGNEMIRVLVFPLLFLYLAVPMGNALLPPLMEFTARSTVWLIQLSGVPVFREGLYFSLPSGNWSVVEACSGVRYLIASVTLGVLYAYLSYRSPWRRAFFVLLSVFVPIVANTLRAYIIVMLGHLSDMKIATGVDHLVYGWLFFGIVMILLFWLGSFFQEPMLKETEPARQAYTRAEDSAPEDKLAINRLLTAVLAIAAVAIWPVLIYQLRFGLEAAAISPPEKIVPQAGWRSVAEPDWDWRPVSTVSGESRAYFKHEEALVALHLQYSVGELNEGELVGSSSALLENDDAWRIVESGKIELEREGKPFKVDQVVLRRGPRTLLARSWYRLGDTFTANDYYAKFLEMKMSFGYGEKISYRIVLATELTEASAVGEIEDELRSAGEVLDGFYQVHFVQQRPDPLVLGEVQR